MARKIRKTRTPDHAARFLAHAYKRAWFNMYYGGRW